MAPLGYPPIIEQSIARDALPLTPNTGTEIYCKTYDNNSPQPVERRKFTRKINGSKKGKMLSVKVTKICSMWMCRLLRLTKEEKIIKHMVRQRISFFI